MVMKKYLKTHYSTNLQTPDNKIQEVTLKDGSKELNYLPGTIMDYASIYS